MTEKFNGNGDRAGGSSIYNRPRRPDADTITYLRGLPLEIEGAKEEVSHFLANNDKESEDFPQGLAAALSAIDEVRKEIASLAGDEHGSQCLEILAQISAPYSEIASRVLLSACSGYHLHLATHRYGSHVVQTILQLAVSSSSEVDLGLHKEAPQFSESADNLPTLSDLILGMVNELSPSAPELAIHVCGSHVLRTLLCVLGGVNLVSAVGAVNQNKGDSGALLRGRKKKKKKKNRKPNLGDINNTPHAGTMRVVYRNDSRISTEEFSPFLKTLTLSLLGQPVKTPGELQQLGCHPSAGPVFIILLRVLTYSHPKSRTLIKEDTNDVNSAIADFRLGISRAEPVFEKKSLAHEVAKRLLCWDDSSTEQQHIGDVIYGFAGEPRGSHLLETLLRISPDEVYETIIKYGDFESESSLLEYAEHDVSNYVIQTVLTTVRCKEKAEIMLKAIEKIISNGLGVDRHRRRQGLFWRSCELAARYRVGQESLLKALRLGFGALNVPTEMDNAAEELAGKKKKQRKKASAVEVKDCIPLLINLKEVDEGQKNSLDVAGCRSIYQMLRFSPRLCEEVLKGILEGLSEAELEHLIKDGLGSRCIIDGILDGPVKTPVFIAAVKSLYNKLKGRWVPISSDRVGHHTVMKLFRALPKIDDKAKLVEELASGGNRLSGNAMGRSVLEACLVNEYKENRKEWRKTLTKRISKEENILDEMEELTKSGADREVKSKRKRKRKRPDKQISDDVISEKKSRQGMSVATESIVEALSIPPIKSEL